MNSSLYKCKVVHRREKPSKNIFSYRFYTFLLDLKEVSSFEKNGIPIKYNAFSPLFSFWDKDHFKFQNDPGKERSTYEAVVGYLKKKLPDLSVGKVHLLTNLRTFGYGFSPVSFYFCYDQKNVLRATLVEVTNTFYEQKDYLLTSSGESRQKKYFYVSPFIKYDTDFCFEIHPPGAQLKIRIDSEKNKEKVLEAELTGRSLPMTKMALIRLFLFYPVITMRIIYLIHYQAFKLYLKKVPYFKKKETDEKIKGSFV